MCIKYLIDPNIDTLTEKVRESVETILSYGGIEGDHHRAWTIDQTLFAILGEEEYKKVIEQYEDGGEYEWDVGIAP